MAGRKTSGVALVDVLAGSFRAKEALRLFLQTISGERTVVEASRKLGISETAFYVKRRRWLSEMILLLEPRKPGRPPREQPAQAERVQELQDELRAVKQELRASQVREEIALAMPGRVGQGRRRGGPRAEKKTSSRVR